MNFATSLSSVIVATTLAFGWPSTLLAEDNSLDMVQNPHSILGFIQLNKTSFREVVNRLLARGCEALVEGNGMEIKPGCFGLPGNPIILVQNFWSQFRPDEFNENIKYSLRKIPPTMGDAPVLRIVISMDKPDANYWDEYYESMVRVWGDPEATDGSGSGGKSFSTAFWHKDGDEITMQGFEDGVFQIIYESQQWLEAEKDRSKAIEERRRQDLDALL